MADQHLEFALQLRWGDMDINHHINNVQIARIFEESRVRSFSAWLPEFPERPADFAMVVARQDIAFTAVLEYGPDPIRVRTCVKRIGTSSFTMALTLIDPFGTTCAIAETTMVVTDPRTGRSTPLPRGLREVIEDHLDPAAGIPVRS